MGSEIWSGEDIRNILLAIYAAKILPEPDTGDNSPTTSEERFYRWGCRVATQALMLAFGLPLEQLDQIPRQTSSRKRPRTTSGTEHWWLEDIENIVAAVYRSAISAQACQQPSPQTDRYYQGIGEVVSALLQALGSRQDPRRWSKQVSADRFWREPTGLPPRLIGKETEPSS